MSAVLPPGDAALIARALWRPLLFNNLDFVETQCIYAIVFFLNRIVAMCRIRGRSAR
jgi:hypothetical protein